MASPPLYSVNPPYPDQSGHATVSQDGAPTGDDNSYPPSQPQPRRYSPPAVQPMGHGQPQPIISQPTPTNVHRQFDVADGLMALPARSPKNRDEIPPGLEYLNSIDKLFIEQQVELLEVFSGFEMNNTYLVKDPEGNNLFYAVENSDSFSRMFSGNLRPFHMRILDENRQEVIHVSRPYRCDSCLFPCCLQKLKVYAPPGDLVGIVEQIWSPSIPLFDIKNEYGQRILKIEGPVWHWGMLGNIEFEVLSRKRKKVGRISKIWTSFEREWITDADNYGISFPADLDVRTKAVMLGACFLIVSGPFIDFKIF